MTKTKSKRNRIALIAAILVVVCLGIWYMVAAQPAPKKNVSTNTTTTKTDTISSDDANKNDPTLDKKNQPTTTPATQTKTLYITMSRPVNNDTVPLAEGIEVRTVITGATTGTCSVVATGPNGKTITKTANIAAQTSYGSCSVDVPSAEVSAGTWQIAMTATSGDASGKTNVTVKVQ